MRKESKPKWIISEDYGVGIDSLNWKLYQRVIAKKEGKADGWKVIGYYPKLGDLFYSLFGAMMLNDCDSADIPEHVDQAVDAWQRAARQLKEFMDGIAGLDTLPPAYANFNLTKETEK